MKVVALLALLAAPVFGQGVDPFAEVDPFAPVEPAGPPRMIRMQVEFVELAHADCTKLLTGSRESADATALRVKLAEMVGQDRAEVVETMMVVARSGEKAASQSFREFIYPSDYEPSGLSGATVMQPTPDQMRKAGLRALLRIPYASPLFFETRNLGSTFEVAPNLRADNKTVDVSFAPEMVLPAGFEVYSEFKAIGGHVHQDRWPVFVTERVNTALTCRDGQYVLVTVLTPSNDEGQIDPSRKMMVLLKCDVLVVKDAAK